MRPLRWEVMGVHPLSFAAVGWGSRGDALDWVVQEHPGTTGFDAVGSFGWLRVEVSGGLVKHPAKPYVRTLMSTPSLPRQL